MAQFLVRNLEDGVRDELRLLAERNGQSMEETVREILRAAVAGQQAKPTRLGSAISNRFRKRGLDHPVDELKGQSVVPPSFGK